MPKVSVIMPVYNGEKYIEKAINSILNQTYKDFELILIDDCSPDSSIEIAKKLNDPRIRIIQNEKNSGIAFSRNVGLKAARGEYIALMDDDDLTVPHRFEKQVAYLDNHLDIDVVGGQVALIDENDNITCIRNTPLINPKFIKATLMIRDPIGNGSAMFRKKLIEDNSILYKDGCCGMEDYLFWIDCSLHGNITNIQEIMLYWRCTNQNETYKNRVILEKKRREKYSEIQKYAMNMNGIDLDEIEIEIVTNMLIEDMSTNSVSVEELRKLYIVLKKIIHQVYEKGMNNANEIRIMLRKEFSKRTEFSELWEK